MTRVLPVSNAWTRSFASSTIKFSVSAIQFSLMGRKPDNVRDRTMN
ncbi:MAG: hypothetical protein ACL7BU_02895 [Candidatus Phlomobacter fragariae]